ncbi:MAG: LysR substrate-binding domain-containing protein [Microvirga sp.]
MPRAVPISLFRAFEAAGRTGSFRAAALELHLTPSAVSHAIRKLEEFLGTHLFDRGTRKVHLSYEGELLMRHVNRAFEDLRRGMDVVSTRGPGLLRLHCAPSFAAQWLTPRLAGFLKRHPSVEVRLAAGTDYTRFTADDFDADIVYGPPRADGLIVVPLGEEIVTPMCAPDLAARIATPSDLRDTVRIQSDSKQIQWADWFSANALVPPPPNGSRFDRSFLAIAAAVAGLGVALESTRLAERELATGRLVTPLSGSGAAIRYVGHNLVYPRYAQRRPPLRVFAEWLMGELGIADSGGAAG